jgi:type 1 glutamine amidotransferase
MPTVWTKKYGQGRVFYNAIGHRASDLETGVAKELMRRGLVWASR